MVSPLPPQTHDFSINVIGSKTKQSYSGNFSVKLPNLLEEGEIKRTYSIFTRDLNTAAFPATDDFYWVLATLHHVVTDYPKWWKEFREAPRDSNVFTTIYAEYMKFVDEWNDDGDEDEITENTGEAS